MPKRVDHSKRRAEICEAVIRITVKGGLGSATFREVAGEAGVSVRLVQYYFGTKDELLLATQRHVAAKSVARVQRLLAGDGDSPHDVLRTIMGSFVPIDDESREAMLMYVALFTASLLDPVLRRKEAAEPTVSMRRVFEHELRRANLRAGVDLEQESLRLLLMVSGLSQGVLDGQLTAEDAFAAIDYSLERAMRS